MNTSESITFVSRDDAGIVPRQVIKLYHLHDPDNLTNVEQFEKNYLESTGGSAVYVTREEVQAHAARLDVDKLETQQQTIRAYGLDNAANVEVHHTQAKRTTITSKGSGSESEMVSVNGGSQLSTKYPIKRVNSVKFSLITANGGKYGGEYIIDKSGVLQLNEPCYGSVVIDYAHEWRNITVLGLDSSAINKRPAYVLVTSDNGNDSIEVTFPDVRDAESAIQPTDNTFIKIWAHRNNNNRAIPDSFDVRQFYELERTISPVNVDGVAIDRALSVLMQEGDRGQKIQFTFDLPKP
ncbi:hypothetical protein NVP1215B_081 [Vibrio phage 1.215.B._10N.222.54.F7]|nr:hypothetical protein NVP1215A_081 [Vibrio phage 1.215.A._10N.222.54.F7]AUR96104.1 hypothetical protein NVP1215B_081 [Vibrio phage 1.215.B._10N.222.54.F7]